MKKLLYVTHSAGYRHEVLPYSQEVLKRLGSEAGAFEADCTDDVATVNWDDLARYDAVAFCTTGSLPMSDAAKNALIDFVKGGKAFIGIHNATDTFYDFAPYGEMVGGYFNGHPWHQEVGIIVEDRTHPATRDLPEHFHIHDEIYTHKNWSREKTHVLMRLDNSTVDLEKAAGNRDDNDFAMAWCHPFGAGRVFYTALGHGEPTWSSELFHKHLLGGIRWAMREVE
ncbi:MAG: ThuA domain-containing protein [Armatimonadota bacterium]|nr:ThuA domain-containing protein [Armatimonadota bacterium]